VRELLEGRRFGFALRPAFGNIAAGFGIALFLLDLVSWSGWGVRETNAIVVASVWVGAATAILALLSLATALAERADVPDEEANLARADAIAVGVAALLYVATTAARSIDSGAAAASPLALLLEVAGLILLLAGAALSSVLYASREWEELDEIVHERHRRRHAAGR
jgi:hypothetical protein